MNNTTIAELFQEAFGLDFLTMKTGKPAYVGEANIGILSLRKGETSPTLNRILYCVKKPKATRYKITLSSGAALITSAEHKFAIYGAGGLSWIPARDLTLESSLIKDSGGTTAVAKIEKLPKAHTLDIQVENAENYYSQGVLSHNSMHGPDFKVADGRAIKFYASNRSRITKIDTIKEKGVAVGIEMKVKNGKNKAGIPFREAILQLYFEGGFDTSKEWIDFIIQFNIVDQKGAYFKSDKYNFSLQGREKLQAWLNEHPAEYEGIKKQINEALCSTTNLDVENASGYDEEDSIPDIPSDALEETVGE